MTIALTEVPWLSPGAPFPDPEISTREGIVALGGDLSVSTLLDAYTRGIFPWFSENEPIIWWSPDPRFVIVPEEIHVSASMRKILKKGTFTITENNAFDAVMAACALTRPDGTWITQEMFDAYTAFHRAGHAHSFEVWQDGELAGGLYGVRIGRIFFGESMFSLRPNASKAALIHLTEDCRRRDIPLIDSQVHTPHVERMGGRYIPRKEYLKRLREALR
jgi:leucyl/phenylalanyl-tRNA---protein transferase